MANKKKSAGKRRTDYQAPKKSAAAKSKSEDRARVKEERRAAAVPERPSPRRGATSTLSWWLLGGGIAAIVALVVVLSVVTGENQTGVTDADAWDLPVLDDDNDADGDGRVTLAEFEGKPLVVNFFASWCVSCDRELPIFRQAVDDFADDVQIAFINSNETGNWRPMAERNGIDDQILIDDIGGGNNNGLYRSLGGTGGMPITAFYDAEGNLFDVVFGEFNSTALYEALMRVMAA